MKICALCKIEKPITEYRPWTQRKDGLHCWCKPCLQIKKTESYHRNREKILAKQKVYKQLNPEKTREARARSTQARKEHYARVKKEWRIRTRAERLVQKALYRKNRYANDPRYALEVICRSRILGAFRANGVRKESPTAKMLGCSYEELTSHLERQFAQGMTWENRGTAWHIDHRVPLASASTAQELEALCHFSNLQPLWAGDNYAKGAKMPHEWEGLNHGRLDHL